jgi:DNA uptake protein ComE-like DNA-binding protein
VRGLSSVRCAALALLFAFLSLDSLLSNPRNAGARLEQWERLPEAMWSSGKLDAATMRSSGTLDPATMSARDLRRLPGIGPTRALAIARARWQEGWRDPASWEAISGIGRETVRAIEAALGGP